MGKINHNDAHYIEILVRNLYKLDLGKPPLIANADTFETSPIYAAIMIVSYIYAKGLPTEDRQLNDWIGKYELDFNEISEEIPEKLVNNYIKDLEKIVDHYTSYDESTRKNRRPPSIAQGAAARSEKLFGDAAVLEIICAVMFSDFTQDTAGVADGDDPARQIMRDDAARSDPAVFPDMNGGVILICLLAQRGQDGVRRRCNDHIRRKHGIIADIDMRIIHQREIEIGIDMPAEMYMLSAEIGMQGRLNIAILPDLGKHFPQHCSALLHFRGAGLIKVVKAVQAALLLGCNFRISRQIKLAGMHFLLHAHIAFSPSSAVRICCFFQICSMR